MAATRGLWAIALILVTGTPAAQAHDRPAPGGRESAVEPRPALSCPQLFGTEETRSRNRARRQRTLHWTLEEPAGITVVHSNHGWEDVTEFRIAGVELLGRTRTGAQTAAVQLSEPLAEEIGCPTGRYVVRRDDALGRTAEVLAVFRNTLLITLDGRLGYLAVADAPRPIWLLAWHLPDVSLRPPAKGGGAIRSAPPPPRQNTQQPKPKPKPKPKPAQPRRRKR